MGCDCSRQQAKTLFNHKSFSKKNAFIIKIYIPNSPNVKVIIYECKEEYMLITDLVNKTLYCEAYSEGIDANFISLYNKEKNEFEYYIQRLVGIEMENEDIPSLGKNWVPYINNKIENWTDICRLNRLIKKGDSLEFKFENFHKK